MGHARQHPALSDRLRACLVECEGRDVVQPCLQRQEEVFKACALSALLQFVQRNRLFLEEGPCLNAAQVGDMAAGAERLRDVAREAADIGAFGDVGDKGCLALLRFAGADSMQRGQDLSVRLVGRGTWEFDVLGYVQSRNFTNVVVSSTRFVPTLDQRNTPATGIGGKIEVRPPVGDDSVLRLGMDYRRASGTLYEDAISTATGAVTERRTAGGRNDDLGLFAELDRIGYSGWIGCEYKPATTTEAGLGWRQRLAH